MTCHSIEIEPIRYRSCLLGVSAKNHAFIEVQFSFKLYVGGHGEKKPPCSLKFQRNRRSPNSEVPRKPPGEQQKSTSDARDVQQIQNNVVPIILS